MLMDRTNWNLKEVILDVLRRGTRKVSAYWMLPRQIIECDMSV